MNSPIAPESTTKEKIATFAEAASQLNRHARRTLLGKLKRKRRKIQRARVRFEKKYGKIPAEKQTLSGLISGEANI